MIIVSSENSWGLCFLFAQGIISTNLLFCPRISDKMPPHFRQNGHLRVTYFGQVQLKLVAFLDLPDFFWGAFFSLKLLDLFLNCLVFFPKMFLTFQTKRPLPPGHLPGAGTLLAFLLATLHLTSFEI